MMKDEIESFNDSIYEWSIKWADFYCISEHNNKTADFKKDIEMYFPTHFSGTPSISDEKISFENMLLKNNYDIDKTKLTRWKFGNQYFAGNLRRALSFTNFSEIDNVFTPTTALVSNIFWKNIYSPNNFPIFDQRTMRSFSILNKRKTENANSLWLYGVPGGKKILEYYNDVFKNRLLVDAYDKNIREIILKLRIIDYALFSFDRLIIKKSVNKWLPIDQPVESIFDKTLDTISFRNYTIKI